MNLSISRSIEMNFLLTNNMNIFSLVAPIISKDAPDWFKISYIIYATLVVLATFVVFVCPVIYEFLFMKGWFDKRPPANKREKETPKGNGEDEFSRCFRELAQEREAKSKKP